MKETLLVYRPFWVWDEVWMDAVDGKVVCDPLGKRRLFSTLFLWFDQAISGTV
ncbi:MAG: hypothetical protein WC314_26480 [Vulcanimicrobiota bacterium]